jgi:membrane protease subunit HflK
MALLGLIVQAIVAILLLVVGAWANLVSIMAAGWYAIGGLPLWLCLSIVFMQHQRERREALESEQLGGGSATIFDQSEDNLTIENRRLASQYKWLVPLMSFLVAAYLIGIAIWLYSWGPSPITDELRENALLIGGVLAGISFVMFLLARYAAGMAKQPQWQMLSGGAGFLMGNVLVSFSLLGCLFLLAGGMAEAPVVWAERAVPIFMMIAGAEILANLILGFYRPRRAGEFPRAAFDSRLLALLASPESITKTVSETINYQLGFEITSNWFWKMLQRWFPKLVGLAMLILWATTSMIVIEPNQMAVVTDYHTGGRDHPVVYGPGLRWKLPWPLSGVDRYDVHGVRVMKIGTDSDLADIDEAPAILWTNKHTLEDPEPMMVAAKLSGELASEEDTPLVGLVNVEIYLHYRIKSGAKPKQAREHLLQYVRANGDAEAGTDGRLRNIATRIIAQKLMSHTIDEWIGQARVDAGMQLRDQIQAAADDAIVAPEQRGLGLKILSVKVAGIHPPQKVAPEFHEVVAAGQKQEAEKQKAEQEAIRILAEAAGSERQARVIVQKIDRLEQLRKTEKLDEVKITVAEVDLSRSMASAGGTAAELIAKATADRWVKANRERGRVDRYLKRYETWKASPEWYSWHLYLSALSEGMADANKFLILTRGKKLILRGDFRNADSLSPEEMLRQMKFQEKSNN